MTDLGDIFLTLAARGAEGGDDSVHHLVIVSHYRQAVLIAVIISGNQVEASNDLHRQLPHVGGGAHRLVAHLHRPSGSHSAPRPPGARPARRLATGPRSRGRRLLATSRSSRSPTSRR